MDIWVLVALVALVVLIVIAAVLLAVWLRRTARSEDAVAASAPDPKTGTSDDDWFHAIR